MLQTNRQTDRHANITQFVSDAYVNRGDTEVVCGGELRALGEEPQRGPGVEPLAGDSGASPSPFPQKLNTFSYLTNHFFLAILHMAF